MYVGRFLRRLVRFLPVHRTGNVRLSAGGIDARRHAGREARRHRQRCGRPGIDEGVAGGRSADVAAHRTRRSRTPRRAHGGRDHPRSIPGPPAARPERSAMMVSLGPFPMSLVVLLVALAIAALVARQFVVPLPGQPAIKPLSTFLDMLMVGVLAARLAFVLAWWPQYLADPWSIVQIGRASCRERVWPYV